MDSVFRFYLPFAIVAAMAIVFFTRQKRLLPQVKPVVSYLLFVVGAVSFVPSLFSRDILSLLGIGRILSLENLFYSSLVNAATTEVPKIIFILVVLYRFGRGNRIGTYMLITVPLILGFALVSTASQVVHPMNTGQYLITGYADVAFNICICIIMGFFVGLQKVTNSRALYPLIGVAIVLALHVFLEFVLYLKEIDLAIIFGLDLVLIGFLLIHLSDARHNERLLWQNSCCD